MKKDKDFVLLTPELYESLADDQRQKIKDILINAKITNKKYENNRLSHQ